MQAAGVAIVALVVAQLALSLYGMVQRARGTRRQLSLSAGLLAERIRMASAARSEREHQQQHWNGYRKFVVLNKVREAEGICSVYLAPNDGKPLPLFEAGQYLTFRFAIPGVEKPIVRCYSLSDAAHENYYRITVKQVRPPEDQPDAPPGVVSTFINESLDTGEILDVGAPRGHFTLDVWGQRPVVLIAGGIGITPLLCMVNAAIAAGSTREMWLLYGVMDGRQHVMKDHLNRLAAENENLRLQVFYSHPRDEDVEGRDYHHGCRITVGLLKKFLYTSNYRFYICGPPPMMHDLIRDLKAWGVPESSIYTEAFGAKTVDKALSVSPAKAADAGQPGAAARTNVRFERSAKECIWEDGGTLLDFAEKNGVAIESGCRAGGCGTCLVALKSGRVRYLSEPDAEPEENACLTCISVPDGSVVLDA